MKTVSEPARHYGGPHSPGRTNFQMGTTVFSAELAKAVVPLTPQRAYDLALVAYRTSRRDIP
jgi:hypothetical protein